MKQRKRLATAVLVAVAAVAGTAATAGANPTCSCTSTWVAPNRIVFSSNDNGDWEIYSVKQDGTDRRRLTFSPGFDGYPSQAGAQIAFTSFRDGNHEIYVMNADGTNQRRVTYNFAADTEPAFNPSGTRIAFTSNRAGNIRQIFVMDANGSNVGQMTSDRAGQGSNRTPAWSPDGRRIAFVTSRNGQPRSIWTMDTLGASQTRVSVDGADDPAWSPDSSKIAYDVRQPDTNELDVYWTSASSPGTTVRVTLVSGHYDPSWSPDGSTIVFTSYDRSMPGRNRLRTAPSSGSSTFKTVTSPTYGIDHQASWGFPQPLSASQG